MIYFSLTERLIPDEKKDPRKDLDRLLGVARWQPLGGTSRPSNVPDDAPVWWAGDEEASQSFLRGMGLTVSD